MPAQSTEARADIYQRVTDKIIAQLEAGIVPWVQPWQNSDKPGSIALPHNAATGRSYSGINILLLWAAGEAYGSLGGNVRKGEHGTMVVYADRFIPKAEAARVASEGGEARPVYFLKAYTVFNVAQCEGLTIEGAAAVTAPTLPEMHAAADALIRNTGARMLVAGNRAAYWPERDTITIPPMQAYEPNPTNWYRTALHELAHWTGADHRLARKFGASHGSHDYAREELVAEMTAAFTCASLGIVPTVRHADYIGSWLAVLRDDSRAIVQAASKASKAADYLLAFADADAEPMQAAA